MTAAGIRRSPSWAFDRRLDHLPGTDGWPIVGSTLDFLRDQEGWGARMVERHGRVYRANTFLQRSVTVADPDVVERLLKDREGLFSSEHGWANIVGQFFPRGLMLRDFDVHRLHKGILQEAFKKTALKGYLDEVGPRVDRAIATWGGDGFAPLYPRLKRLTLDVAGAVFCGVEPGETLDRLTSAFAAMMEGTFALVRLPVPGTAYARAVRGRRFLERWVAEQVPARRASEGRDLLSILARASDAEGNRLTDGEVVDHVIFLLLAAHDTTTSALTNLLHELARAPVWQERLRRQLCDLPTPLSWDALLAPTDVDLAIKETLRLHPPVTSIPRLALRPCELAGHRIPEHTTVWLDVGRIHRDPAHWTDPERFDPDRFAPGRAEHQRHPGVYLPFGGGAHVCLGMQFAGMEIRAVLHALLTRFRVELPDGYRPRRQIVPFPKPVDDLPVRLVAV